MRYKILELIATSNHSNHHRVFLQVCLKFSCLVKDFLLVKFSSNYHCILITRETIHIWRFHGRYRITHHIYFLHIYIYTTHRSRIKSITKLREKHSQSLSSHKKNILKRNIDPGNSQSFLSRRAIDPLPCACECKSTRVSRLCPIVDRRNSGSKCVSATPSNYYPSCKRATRTGNGGGHRGKK